LLLAFPSPMAAADPYLVEPAKSGRSTCKASKLTIEKGELRFGSFVDMGGHGSYHWRKLDYISDKQAANVMTKLGGFEKVGGYAALTAAQQKKFAKAFDKAGKKGVAKDKAKAKIITDKEKAKAAKAKGKDAKAKAKAKELALKEKAKAKKKGKFASKVAAKTAPKAKAKAPAETVAPAAKAREPPAAKAREPPAAKVDRAPLPPTAEQHKFLDAAKISDFKTVREMLEATPALINVQPAGRWSALHQAAQNGKPTAVKMLLGKGASVTLVTKDKQTPHDVAHASCKALVAPPAAKRKRDDGSA